MMTNLLIQPSFDATDTNKLLDLTIEFGFRNTEKDRLERVATLRRQHRYNKTAPEFGISWASWGEQTLENTRYFADAMREAVEFGQLLEQGLISDAALVALRDTMRRDALRAQQEGK